MTVLPAFGRDYSTIAAVLADWNEGKDFLVADVTNRWDGKPMNKQSAEEAGIFKVGIRYAKKTKQVFVVFKDGKWKKFG
jgi:hypothetical protein